jgi:mannose-6-phosphate isomerase-like protein (cupin superfamily)
MAIESKTAASVFTFMSDEIAAGTGDVYLPGAEGLSAVVKRYREGGENKMHCHPGEDHTFYILQGQATFHLDQEENVVVVNANEAVHLPRGTYYRFLSSGDEKLLMLRVGNARDNHGRLDPEGNPIVSRAEVVAGRTYIQGKELPF